MSSLSAGAYNVSAGARFPMNLSVASRELGISIQRLSRHLKILQVPVTRSGYAVLLDREGYARVRRALTKNEVRRGRKKKAS
jgi:DNA-binding transcriptional ArsR family regulator